MLNKAKNEVKQVIDATPNYAAKDRNRVIDENRKKRVRHTYFHEYRSLQQLCIYILQNEKALVGFGPKKSYGVLFDGSWLWEEYINSLVSDVFYHPMNRSKKGAQWLFAGNSGLIYPDFIGKNSNDRIIADAKYKPFTNIGNDDYLQLLAYMYRFDAKHAYYFYPETGTIKNKKLLLNSGSTYENNVMARSDVYLIKYSLPIPNESITYDEFVTKIQENEIEFVKGIDYSIH